MFPPSTSVFESTGHTRFSLEYGQKVTLLLNLQSQLHTAAFQGEYHEFVITTCLKFPRLRTHPSVHLKSTGNANVLLVFQTARLHLLQKPINFLHYLATLWRFKDLGSSSIRLGVLLTSSDKTSTNCFTDNAIQSSTEKYSFNTIVWSCVDHGFDTKPRKKHSLFVLFTSVSLTCAPQLDVLYFSIHLRS